MFKLYNTQVEVSRDLSNYFKNVCPNISKPHLKLLAPIILGMIESESVVTTDIVKKLKGDFSLVSPFSNVRRLERFFNNEKFAVYDFYDSIIKNVISIYKLKNKKVYISFDHMYCRDSFTIFLMSLRIGKQRHSFMVPLFQRKR